MRIPEAGEQRSAAEGLDRRALIRRRKPGSGIKDPPLVFHKIFVNIIFTIAGNDSAVINFHLCSTVLKTAQFVVRVTQTQRFHACEALIERRADGGIAARYFVERVPAYDV